MRIRTNFQLGKNWQNLAKVGPQSLLLFAFSTFHLARRFATPKAHQREQQERPIGAGERVHESCLQLPIGGHSLRLLLLAFCFSLVASCFLLAVRKL